ncbi:MAG: hypothetical protein LBJ61_00800 [Deltaproteobacteria bacterium]|jgi:hypothetical protein|nr:hypothetical protein [Deltaproteobacteria bacterium]
MFNFIKILLLSILSSFFILNNSIAVAQSEFSQQDLERMSIFISKILEVQAIHSYRVNDMELSDILYFAVEHNLYNNYNTRIKSCNRKFDQGKCKEIEVSYLYETIKKYFDINVVFNSDLYIMDGMKYYFTGHSYQFPDFGNEIGVRGVVKTASRLSGNRILLKGDAIYIPKNSINAAFEAVIRPHRWNGQDTYALISIKWIRY